MHADRPSLTAIKVARAVLLLDDTPAFAGVMPRDLVETTRDLLRAAGLFPPWQERLVGSRRLQRWIKDYDARVGEQLLMVAVRKRFIDDEARAAVAEGARQVLVVGAGFDTLALRLAEAHPDMIAVEVDHPATAVVKAAALRELGRKPPGLRLAKADLASTSLPDVLVRVPDYDPSAKTIVVAEGLLMYLHDEDVRGLFRALHEVTGPDSLALFTYLETQTLEQRLGRLQRMAELAFRAVGESLRFTLAEPELAGYLAPQGWSYASDPERFDLGQRYLHRAPSARRVGLEHVALARRS